jgi:hypothetical protein
MHSLFKSRVAGVFGVFVWEIPERRVEKGECRTTDRKAAGGFNGQGVPWDIRKQRMGVWRLQASCNILGIIPMTSGTRMSLQDSSIPSHGSKPQLSVNDPRVSPTCVFSLGTSRGDTFETRNGAPPSTLTPKSVHNPPAAANTWINHRNMRAI